MRVLHVVESLLSGVAVALEDYIRNTSEIEHVVLGYRRPGSQKADSLDELAEVIPMETSHGRRLRQVRSVANLVQPTLIHAHSSFGGFYTRMSLPAGRFVVVYTPHCYAMERKDIRRTSRLAFGLAEALMHPRTACVAAGSPREADQARRFRPRRPVVYVPYVVDTNRSPRSGPLGSPLRVVTVGRLTAAKDPDFLAAAAASPAGRRLQWKWIVIPGGDDRYARRLSDAGVELTAVSRADTLRRFELGQEDVYVHTAAWECAPLTLLEAAACGMPVVARRIPALTSLGLKALYDTPEALATGIAGLADDPAGFADLCASSRALTAGHTPEAQRKALWRAYRLALGERTPEDTAAGVVQ